MSKYIDADKLIAEIRRIVEEETPISKGSDYYHGVSDTADKLLSFITSLQQEQPEINETEVVESDATIRGIKTKLNTIIFIAPDDWKPGDKVEAIITRKGD